MHTTARRFDRERAGSPAARGASGREDSAQVLVVGAGPAGLTVALTLARYGIDVLVVERHAGTSPFPKSTGVSTRTMELLRGWGLEERVRAGAMRVEPWLSVSASLVGPVLASMPIGYPTDEQALAVSPTRPCYCAQDHLEPVLLEHLRSRGGRVRFGTELVELAADPGGATARVRERASEREYRIHARYLVGADGPRSGVRSALGIGVRELGSLGEFVAVTFRAGPAGLTGRLGRAPSALNAVEQEDASGLFVPTSTDDRWVYARRLAPGADAPTIHPAAVDWTRTLRTATGVPDLRPEILAVMPFEMGAHVASAFRSGSAFLVGDAAHRTTPEGGIGMNTAIHAADNLGWKLAWALRGHGGDQLLDSYQAEREPVGAANAAWSLRDGSPAPTDGVTIDLGVRYASMLDPVMVDPVMVGTAAEEAGGVGRRAPHAWVRLGGQRISTLDLFDARLTVLTGPDGWAWHRAAADLAVDGAPVTALSLGHDVDDEDGSVARRYRLGRTGAVLVRPDGYLAWRHPGAEGEDAVPAATAALRAAVDRTLGRTYAGPLPAAVG